MDKRGLQIAAIISVAVLLARLSDVLFTYSVTPDLALERNPFVMQGAGWSFVIVSNVMVVAAASAASFYHWQRREKLPPAGLDFLHFHRHFYFGEQRPLYHLLYSFPRRGHNLWFLGAFLPAALIGVSLWIDASHALALASESYRAIHNWIVGELWRLVLGVTFMVSFSYWALMALEWRAYQKRHAAPDTED